VKVAEVVKIMRVVLPCHHLPTSESIKVLSTSQSQHRAYVHYLPDFSGCAFFWHVQGLHVMSRTCCRKLLCAASETLKVTAPSLRVTFPDLCTRNLPMRPAGCECGCTIQ
jgi:hypothetical protein